MAILKPVGAYPYIRDPTIKINFKADEKELCKHRNWLVITRFNVYYGFELIVAVSPSQMLMIIRIGSDTEVEALIWESKTGVLASVHPLMKT